MISKRIKVYIYLIVAILIEVTVLYIWKENKKVRCINEYELKMNIIKAKIEQKKKEISDDFERRKYLASGKNVYERIYNTQEQGIITLISRLSQEAFPEDWKKVVKVEEFTNFILLIQPNTIKNRLPVKNIIKYIIPVVKYSYPYLKNIAVFDKNHKCYLYFDENTIEHLRIYRTIDRIIIGKIERQGLLFTKFNSVKISFVKERGHIFIPVMVGGVYKCTMMLDTGASMTVISKELVLKTSYDGEDLKNLKTKSFSTANGLMTCPVVERSISVGGIDRKLQVAINVNSTLNLLGVDFFNGYNYLIDSEDNCIYVWVE
ncbi:MAG: retropepsin-like aspartic protease family protein [Candidatus Helarchaeota archaeon]